MAKNRPVTVASKIDADIFTRFAIYDTFVRQKRWRRPLVFCIIMLVFSAVCFFLKDRFGQSSLLSLVLLSVGLVVPVVYVLMFILSAREQAAKLHLSPAAAQYYVELDDAGIRVHNEREKTEFKWKQIYCAVLRRDCIYLYVTPGNAYLLPYCDEAVEAWKLIQEKIPNRLSGNKRLLHGNSDRKF